MGNLNVGPAPVNNAYVPNSVTCGSAKNPMRMTPEFVTCAERCERLQEAYDEKLYGRSTKVAIAACWQTCVIDRCKKQDHELQE